MIKGDIVTTTFEGIKASNTFIIYKKTLVIDGENSFLVHHPLAPDVLIEKLASELNTEGPRLKDSVERALDFIGARKNLLGHIALSDFKALCISFVVTRKLTPQQKAILATLSGVIASNVFEEDIIGAMHHIAKNEAILDDFNLRWYSNFAELFAGTRHIVSKKQRAAIFNIAGFVLAELSMPIVVK